MAITTVLFDKVPEPRDITTMEDVVKVMYHFLKLSTLDRKFIHNLYSRNVNKSKPVTSNQHILMVKVIDKYRRQLASNGFDADALTQCSWMIPPILSSERDTNPWISLDSDNIVFCTPYREKFIAAVRRHGKAEWNSDQREYRMSYSAKNLRWAIETIMLHYPMENYSFDISQEIQDIIDSLMPYEQCYWNPTLVKSKTGRYYIAATNEYLEAALPDEYNEYKITPRCFILLTDMGIHISEQEQAELGDKYPSWQVQFMATRTPIKVEVTRLDALTELFTLCNCNYIFNEMFYVDDKNIANINTYLSTWNSKLGADIEQPATKSVRNLKVRDLIAKHYRNILANRISVVLTSSVSANTGSTLMDRATRTIILVDSTPIRIK